MDESPYQLYADLLTDKDRSDLVQFEIERQSRKFAMSMKRLWKISTCDFSK